MVAEGLAGAVVSILSTRLARTGWRATGTPGKDTPAGGLLRDLLGELMGLIVLPYLGPVIAREERTRPAPVDPAPAPLPARGGWQQSGRQVSLARPGAAAGFSVADYLSHGARAGGDRAGARRLEPRRCAPRADQRPGPGLKAPLASGASRAGAEHRPRAGPRRTERMAPDARRAKSSSRASKGAPTTTKYRPRDDEPEPIASKGAIQ